MERCCQQNHDGDVIGKTNEAFTFHTDVEFIIRSLFLETSVS